MKRLVMTLAAAAGLAIPSIAVAHHGSAAFDTGKTAVLKGTVVEWIYSNPHCLLKIDVKSEDGKVVQWVAEGQAPNVIFPGGYRKDTFKVGDPVTVTVEPVKNNQPMGRILKTELANGKVLGRASSAGSDEAIQRRE